jgi:protein-S-isoprenylcysteine O-methyltransferase Ste14
MIEPDWMAWSSLPLPSWLRWLGVALAVCSGVLVVWTFHHLGKNLTDTVVTRESRAIPW